MILIEREGESVWDFTQDELIGLSKLKDHTARRWESQGQGQVSNVGVGGKGFYWWKEIPLEGRPCLGDKMLP